MELLLHALLGSLFTVFIQNIPKAYRYFKDFNKKAICEMKYSYIWIAKNKTIYIQKYNFIIKKAFISDYKVLAINSDDPKRVYTGKGTKKQLYISFNFKSESLEVEDCSYHKYNISKIEYEKMCFGFWLSTDLTDKVSCGGAILSKEELDDSKLAEYTNRYKKDKDSPVMYIMT